jgi:hypothetical protein
MHRCDVLKRQLSAFHLLLSWNRDSPFTHADGYNHDSNF